MHIIRLVFITALCMSLAAITAGCNDNDEPEAPVHLSVERFEGAFEINARGPVTPRSLTPRTILVYMVADNSLGYAGYDTDDIAEMKLVMAESGIGSNRLIVYHDTSGGSVQLSEITPEGEKTLRSYDPEVSSLRIDRIRDVLSDMRSLTPAREYGLILWSHANGWLWSDTDPNGPAKSFGADRGMQINITNLAEALKGTPLAFIYFDCCHMANVESLYELRHITPIVAASCAELPAPGMRYDLNIPLLAQSKADVVGAAKATFDYYNSLTGSMRTCTMSVINMKALDNLAEYTRAIYACATNPPYDYAPQRFMTSNCTLFDLADYVRAHPDIPAPLLNQWEQALSQAVIYQAATPYIWSQIAIKSHCGLSTYIPGSLATAISKHYTSLSWWDDVVSAKNLQ